VTHASDAADPTGRFSGRVDDYVKTRPSYPRGVLDVLRERCGLSATSVVGDLGSGTGIFTKLLLESGAVVHAVEPNAEMRAAAEAMLDGKARFRSVDGRAEATTLDEASLDLVTAAQAFHWFDVAAAHHEMRRILRAPTTATDDAMPNVALVWNDRDLETTPFLRAYEELLVRRCPKYCELQGKADSVDKFDALLGPGRWTRHAVSNEQRLDRDGLVSRLLSSSYAPRPGEPTHDATIAELYAIFDRHAAGGTVSMRYATVVILGRAA
jgi:SAM-dependent methyltransferase